MKPADATQMRATNVRQRTVADVIISRPWNTLCICLITIIKICRIMFQQMLLY